MTGDLMTKAPGTPRTARRFHPLVGLVVAILGLVVLLTAQQFPNRHRMEADLTQRSTQALHSAGLSGVRVTFTGRDGRLRAASSAEAAQALGIVRALEGVRAAEAEVPPGSERAPVPVPPSVLLTLADGTVSVSGTVPTEASRVALVRAAAEMVGTEDVDDRLTVDDSVTDSALSGLPSVLHALGGKADGTTVALDGGTLTLTGTASSEVRKTAVLAAARSTGAQVVDRLQVADVRRQVAKLPPLTFSLGGASLTAASRTTLVRLGRILRDNPSTRIRVEGHTDSSGSAGSNLVLSRVRARAVLTFLVDQGVAADRLTSRGYGETRLKVPDTSPANRAENRRVELVTSTSTPTTGNNGT
ncbi:OmpA family protein [Plantactinospora sonchi]|uniref:OmpA family protein n=1 Tax=Plantactinospora sonchi TaxID=1544735 RepID=A0ABU7S1W7_9ACTN